jgi:hemerythrin-like domain-containing protein
MPDPFVRLKQDHRKVEELLRRLSETKRPSQRRQQTLDRLEASLQLHMEIEERFIYPLTKRILGSESEQEAETEHNLARDGLSKLRSLESEPGFGAAVAMLTAGLKHHVKEEEKEMFPRLKRGMSRGDLAGVEEEISTARKSSA